MPQNFDEQARELVGAVWFHQFRDIGQTVASWHRGSDLEREPLWLRGGMQPNELSPEFGPALYDAFLSARSQLEWPARQLDIIGADDGLGVTQGGAQGKVMDWLTGAAGLPHHEVFTITVTNVLSHLRAACRAAGKSVAGPVIPPDSDGLLTAAQRALWTLLREEPITFDAAAEQLETSVQTVRQHVYFIRKAGLPIRTRKAIGIWRSADAASLTHR